MQSVNDIAVGYGQQVEGLLERLGARGPGKGAGDLLDQVKHLIDPEVLRKVRWFLQLRNRVVHGKPVEMPMPSREEVERAGRAAVAALEGVLAARARQANATFHPPQQNERQEEPPGPVYRIRERDGAYEFWVGPGGVWVVAEGREALEKARLEAEVRLVTRFPRLSVRAGRRARGRSPLGTGRARTPGGRSPLGTDSVRTPSGLEARLRWGRKQLSPEEVLEAVRLLTQWTIPYRDGVPPYTRRAAPTPRPAGPEDERGRSPVGTAYRRAPRGTPRPGVRRVKLTDVPATFYVGPAGVLVVADFPLIAQSEALRVWEGSGGAIAAVPAVLDPRLKEAQGRVGGVLAFRDEGAIRDYLRGGHLLDNDEVDRVAGWLRNRTCPVPTLRDKRGRYGLRGEEVTEGRTKAPPAFLVELVPPSAPPAPSRVVAVAKGLSWRALFLPELVLFAASAVRTPWMWLVVGVLLLRFQASFGDDLLLWKRWVLWVVGGVEVGLALLPAYLLHPSGSSRDWWPMLILLLPGLASLFRGFWLRWCDRKLYREWSADLFPRSRVR